MVYLLEETKELITFDTRILSEKEIKLQGASTCFISHTKVLKHDLKQLIKLHGEIVKMCKANKIKVSYKNKSKAYLSELKSNGVYDNEYMKYDNYYNELLNGWKSKLERGLFIGYGSDPEYTDLLRPLKFAIDKMFYVDTVLDRVNTIAERLNELKNNLDDCPEQYISITL